MYYSSKSRGFPLLHNPHKSGAVMVIIRTVVTDYEQYSQE